MKLYTFPAASLNVYIPETVREKTRGILFQESLLENGCMLFPHCNWVHSFLIKNPIRLYFLSSDFALISQVNPFLPNSLSPWVINASYTLETSVQFPEQSLPGLLSFFQEILST